jgi:hypothetical protein
MAQHEPFDDEQTLQAPERLVTVLKSLQRENPFIPPSLDELVLAQARRHLSHARRRSSFRLRPLASLAPWAALAASIIFGVWIVLKAPGPRRSGDSAVASSQQSAPKNPPDMLDAFALARRIENGEKPGLGWDFTGDGIVDQRDVDALAREAVRLKKERRS